MTKISEILTLDLKEDIKNVIDLEDRSELEIQHEIESYIVTEGIARHLNNFTSLFTSNIKETGVWISGFYGSGKSYFGKMLGYIVNNPMINGTPARERFIPRLKGVPDESLIENSVRKLESINSRVIFLDIAKQNTDKGLAFTLFSNLLKSLGFKDGLYGYFEFDLLIDGKYDDFKSAVKEISGKDWSDISQRETAKYLRRALCQLDSLSDSEYEDTKKLYEQAIENFSASKFKEELEKYLKFRSDEVLVFVFDEASEALSQEKFKLLDLEGLSEALSSISSKVWTIAIAQEKLDDVINNANVSRSQLTKVTDRFKTKIHLESTEVDVIIRSRLLHKKESGKKLLLEYHKKNEGLVSDATNLKSSFPTKTANADEFADYYPFHKYQFDILQKFLFSSNALVATQIAARGMIITTFDVLRKQMRGKDLYCFTPGYAICTEAQTAPHIGLVNKYDTAKKILKESNSSIDGENLLKTIHLLSDSEVVSPTVENITKSYISDITKYYDVKPVIEEALGLLLEAKVLLLSNNNYRITSDLEGKLLEEMNNFEVEFHTKKRFLINCISKAYKLFATVATLNDGADTFKFSVLSDQDDELAGTGSKHLKLTVFSLFNISENRQDFIEDRKLDTQSQKDLITLVPDNNEFLQIDRLIGEICRYSYVEEKYKSETDQDKRKIVNSFSIIREEKEKDLRNKVERAYYNATAIYMFDEYLLDSDGFKGTISDIQRKMVKNIYTKRISSGLSEGLVPKIFSSRKEDIHRLFSGDDFRFYDKNGNFTGDHLKVVEEINAKITARYVDGRTLESELSGAPWGYSFGTIVSTLAVLFRAGRLSVKYNGEPWFSHEQNGVHEAFTNTTKFKTASFQSITTTLTADQKNEAVELLMNLEADEFIDRRIDWNISDFDLANAIKALADHFIGLVDFEKQRDDEFAELFPSVASQKEILKGFSGKITEKNFVEKVEHLLANKDHFSDAIQIILKAQKFINKNFLKAKEFKNFINEVVNEIRKADRSDMAIHDAHEEFDRLYKQDMVKNFANLQQQAQIVKDSYYKLIKNAGAGMSREYQILGGKIDAAIRTLKTYPAELNVQNQKKLDELKRYCSDRVIKEPVLEYTISCKNCGFSLSDILNYTALAPTKENELLVLQSSFIVEAPKPEPETSGTQGQPPVPKKPRKVSFQITSKVMTVREYKLLLTAQLRLLAAARPDEEIELEISN